MMPCKSGFECKCYLCDFVTLDDSEFKEHIDKTHLPFKIYKQRFGGCQEPITDGKFNCQVCSDSIKHLPSEIDRYSLML